MGPAPACIFEVDAGDGCDTSAIWFCLSLSLSLSLSSSLPLFLFPISLSVSVDIEAAGWKGSLVGISLIIHVPGQRKSINRHVLSAFATLRRRQRESRHSQAALASKAGNLGFKCPKEEHLEFPGRQETSVFAQRSVNQSIFLTTFFRAWPATLGVCWSGVGVLAAETPA